MTGAERQSKYRNTPNGIKKEADYRSSKTFKDLLKKRQERYYVENFLEPIAEVEDKFLYNIERFRESRERRAVNEFLRINYYARLAVIKRTEFFKEKYGQQ